MSASVEDKDAIIAALRVENEVLRERQASRDTAFDERAAHQAATIDVLKAMSASPGDPQPVFNLIVQQVRTLLDTPSSMLFEYDGALLHFRADAGTADLLGRGVIDELLRDYPMAPHRGIVSGRAILDAEVVHVRDLTADPDRSGPMRALPYRSQISVPLLRDGRPIGVLTSASARVDAFSDAQIELLKTFAEQAVIAITSAETYRALRERTAALALRNSEFGERIEHQAATIDVLKAMSASRDEAQPVLDLIARRARDLCNANGVGLYAFDGTAIHLLAAHAHDGFSPAEEERFRARFPMIPAMTSTIGRCVLTRQIDHVRDIDQDTEIGRNWLIEQIKSYLHIPLFRDDRLIGVLGINAVPRGGFTDSQIALLRTFAEQAVIAITSAETWRALRVRTADLQTSLEYQTATSDVLAVISRSTADAQPVFDTLVETAARLCGANDATIAIREGEVCRFVAANQAVSADHERWASIRQRTIIPGRDTISARVLLEGDVVRVADILADPEYALPETVERGNRTMLGVPLLRDGEPIGVIALAWRHVEPYSQRQIELIRTFADQAVIAMENARLLTELQARTRDLEESLDYQTATGDMLKVISRSTFDLQPVLDTVCATAVRLCEADQVAVYRFEDGMLRFAASMGYPPNYAAAQAAAGLFPLQRNTPSVGHRCVAECTVVHILDVAAVPGYPEVAIREGRQRTSLGVPLVRDGEPIGVILLARQRVEPFTEQQIALVSTFADQAVIAIENTRLVTEQREALERQTAITEVLAAINASPGNLAPVFETILHKALRSCGATIGNLFIFHDDRVRLLASVGLSEEAREIRRDFALPGGQHPMRRIRDEKRPVQVPDVADAAFAKIDPDWRRTYVEISNVRAFLNVPLLKDGEAIGLITILRREPGAFPEQQIALLENFAAQAVIAMENARLLTEQREALEQQTATSDILRAINTNPGNPEPVFELILANAHTLCGAEIGSLGTFDGTLFHKVAVRGYGGDLEAFIRKPYALPSALLPLLRGETVHIPDIVEHDFEPDVEAAINGAIADGLRTWLEVPLWSDGRLLGSISAWRRVARPFLEKEIALLESFGAQAVIAIENTRLLTEQREALERQTATAEVLEVINASPGDLTPVFEAMLDKAMRLCGVAFGMLRGYDGEQFYSLAARGLPAPYAAFVSGQTASPGRGSAMARALETGLPMQEVDIRGEEGYKNGSAGMRAIVELGGGRTVLHVPLVKDRVSIGFFTFFRQEVRAFSDKEIALLENFAAQAVIAMENARLLTEQREALERQTAIAEVLRTINENPGDLAPVFHAIMESSLGLGGAAFGALYTYDGERFHMAAIKGVPPEFEDYRRRNPQPTGPDSPPGQLLASKRPVQVVDNRTHPFFVANPDERDAQINLGGVRAVLALPLLNDGAVVGQLVIYRKDPGAFPDKQVGLLENFAAQAVIAMENARLLTEQREALERQTATAEVLEIINASPGDLVPVFDAVLERALRLCGAYGGGMFTVHDMRLKYFAFRGMPDAFVTHRLNSDLPVSVDAPPHRMMLSGRTVTVVDTATDPWFVASPERQRETTGMGGARSVLNVPFMKDGAAVGGIALFRETPGAWPDRQIALLENFAAQAVIAMENARLLTETREALEQQTATAEVLRVINESPGDLAPVFDAILNKAHTLCGAAIGSLYTWDGESVRAVATHGFPEDYAAFARQNHPPNFMIRPLIEGERCHHVPDVKALATRDKHASSIMEQTDARTILMIPLRKDGAFAGFITAVRTEVRPFVEKEIALLENFAAQAVIAMENARLLTELRESLEQQTAMAEVLRVINLNPGDVQPVFDAILGWAHRMCKADRGALGLYEGGMFRAPSVFGYPPETEAYLRAGVPTGPNYEPLFRGERVYIPDREKAAMPESGFADWLDAPTREELFDYLRRAGVSVYLLVPLYKDGALLGLISANRHEARPFSEKEISLLESFAAQAVIAMDNARLLNEIRQRQSELDITFENMGDGVAMFDHEQKLAAWNRNFQDILDLPDDAVRVGLPFADYIRGLAKKGEYGTDADADDQIARLTALLDQANRFERTRPNGRVIDIRQNPIPGGGFVIIYADITERKRAEEALRAARDEAETALRELKLAQANLVQAEKMASLGQLTAGIAHEIKNPLNFVNNFASLSVELLDELKQTAAPAFATLDGNARADVEDLTETLTGNLKKIEEHGKRADGIVRSMLEHSRGSSAERRAVDINDLVDEALNLAYHGARAQDQRFNITLERDLAPGIAPIEVNPQDLTRVFLNLFSNGFYAAHKRASDGPAAFAPALRLTTRDAGNAVEVRVRDNGTGIPADIRDKLFQPFFTTKPTGEGTGLGLSITYDIVTKQHGGTITVDSAVNDFTEFTVAIPRGMTARPGGTP